MMEKIKSIGNKTELSFLSATLSGSNIEIKYNEHHNHTSFNSSSIPQSFWLLVNSSLDNIENSNASRHFADYPESSGVLGIETIIIVVVVSLIPVFVIACLVFLVISFNRIKINTSLWSPSPAGGNEEGKRGAGRTCKTNIQSIMENENAAEHFVCENSDEVPMIDTPMSIYPGDIFPNYLDNSKSSLTTPISNNSIITMTMRNNHLIVETEERIPCSLLNAEQIYACNMASTTNAYIRSELSEYQHSDLLDDMDSYSETHHHHHHTHHNQYGEYTACGEEKRPFYEPTTSRQADEEDQHIELFHKNILVFPNTYDSPLIPPPSQENATIPSCSYDCCVDVYDPAILTDVAASSSSTTTTASADVLASNECVEVSNVCTGYSQSDLNGSTSSNSRRAQTEYGYGNQCEYVSPEYSFNRRRSVSCYETASLCGEKVKTMENTIAIDSPSTKSHSVLPVTDCSPPRLCDFMNPSA